MKNNTTSVLELIAQELVNLSSEGSILVFANSRRVVELMADVLNRMAAQSPYPFPLVLCHHGSLPQNARQTAEATLKSGRNVIVLATSSLELGIDIGFVCRVVQIDPAWTLMALRQRMGRSGRTEGQPTILWMCSRDTMPLREVSLSASLFPNLLRAIAMVRLLLRDVLEPGEAPRLHLSTLTHQILSTLRQWGVLSAERLYELLCVSGPFRKIDPELFVEILRSLKGHDLVAQEGDGSIRLGRQGEDLTDDHEFFAAFMSREELTVRWKQDAIGLLPASELPRGGQHIILGGRRWRVDSINRRTKIIDVTPAEAGAPPVFLGDKGNIHTIIVREMRQVLGDTEIPIFLDPAAAALLHVARAAAQKAGLLERQVLQIPQGIIWLPWVGTRCLLTLELFARRQDIKCTWDDLAVNYPGLSLERFETHLQRIASGKEDPVCLAGFMQRKHYEKFDRFLDSKILDFANGHDRLDMEGARQAAASALAELQGL